jgi:polyhydroxybutyrate depolymerase
MRTTIFGYVLLSGLCVAQEVPDTQYIEFQVGNETRSIELYVPPEFDGDVPSPLVFNLHGTGGVPERQESLSGMSAVADREGFLLAGGRAAYIRPDGARTWNADLDPNGVSDVDYIVAAIDAVDAHFAVDRKRIYSTGMSGGGRMTSRLACELADTLAAVAPVAGVQFGQACNPARPIPLITFHSKDDRVNTYVGGNEERNPSWVAGVEGAIWSWAEAESCGNAATETMVTKKVTKISYADCANNASIVFYSIEDGGHSWPGTPIADMIFERRGNRVNMDVNASELIWAFFEAHSLP